jgi:hypothetical protein
MQSIAILPEKVFNVGSLISSAIDTLLMNNPGSLMGLRELPKIKFKRGRGKITVRRLLRRKYGK